MKPSIWTVEPQLGPSLVPRATKFKIDIVNCKEEDCDWIKVGQCKLADSA